MKALFLSHHPQFSPLSEIVSLCQADGFGIEMSAFSELEIVNDPAQVGIHLKAISGIAGRSLHGPYLDLYPGSPDRSMRRQTFGYFDKVYQAALVLDARHIIFHHNYDPSACTPHEWLTNSRNFWLTFLESKAGDITIHLENIMDDSPEMIIELVRSLNCPYFDVALDIGHVHTYSRRTLSYWIGQLQEMIGYVHLHDNYGSMDEHLGLGKGNIPLIETLDNLNFFAPGAVWAIEAGGPRMLQSIEWLKHHHFNG